MATDHYIESYSHIQNQVVSFNGKAVYSHNSEDFPSFIKSAYKKLGIDYPKFFKMDNLSKLAFLAAEMLLNKESLDCKKEQLIALVLSNRASSLDTDRKHWESIQNPSEYYPSPAVFVYTLPNICLGEISIKHKLYSENSFFIFDEFNAPHLYHYALSLLKGGKAEKVLCGWVDFDGEDYKAFLYLVSKEGKTLHSIEEIKKLYK